MLFLHHHSSPPQNHPFHNHIPFPLPPYPFLSCLHLSHHILFLILSSTRYHLSSDCPSPIVFLSSFLSLPSLFCLSFAYQPTPFLCHFFPFPLLAVPSLLLPPISLPLPISLPALFFLSFSFSPSPFFHPSSSLVMLVLTLKSPRLTAWTSSHPNKPSLMSANGLLKMIKARFYLSLWHIDMEGIRTSFCLLLFSFFLFWVSVFVGPFQLSMLSWRPPSCFQDSWMWWDPRWCHSLLGTSPVFWSFPSSSSFASTPSVSHFGIIMHRPTFFLPLHSGPTPLFPPLHCPSLCYLGILVTLTSFTSCFPCNFLFIPCPFCRCPF